MFGCNSSKKAIKLAQLNTDYPIILYMNKEYKEIARIKFPLKIKLKNNSISKKNYTSIKYKYYPYEKGIGSPLYIEKEGKLSRKKKRLAHMKIKNTYFIPGIA